MLILILICYDMFTYVYILHFCGRHGFKFSLKALATVFPPPAHPQLALPSRLQGRRQHSCISLQILLHQNRIRNATWQYQNVWCRYQSEAKLLKSERTRLFPLCSDFDAFFWLLMKSRWLLDSEHNTTSHSHSQTMLDMYSVQNVYRSFSNIFFDINNSSQTTINHLDSAFDQGGVERTCGAAATLLAPGRGSRRVDQLVHRDRPLTGGNWGVGGDGMWWWWLTSILLWYTMVVMVCYGY